MRNKIIAGAVGAAVFALPLLNSAAVARADGPITTPIACPWGGEDDSMGDAASCNGGFSGSGVWTPPDISLDAGNTPITLTIGSSLKLYIPQLYSPSTLQSSPGPGWVTSSWSLPPGMSTDAYVFPTGNTETTDDVTVNDPDLANSVFPDQVTWAVTAKPLSPGDTLQQGSNGIEVVPSTPPSSTAPSSAPPSSTPSTPPSDESGGSGGSAVMESPMPVSSTPPSSSASPTPPSTTTPTSTASPTPSPHHVRHRRRTPQPPQNPVSAPQDKHVIIRRVVETGGFLGAIAVVVAALAVWWTRRRRRPTDSEDDENAPS